MPAEQTVFFATNRNQTLDANGNEDYGTDFYQPMHGIRFGEARVAKVGGRWVTQSITTAPETAVHEGSGIDAITRYTVMGSTEIFGKLFALARDPKMGDIFAFIHGAACSFKDSVELAAKCAELYSPPGAPLIPVIFSYPANGKYDPLNYLFDRQDASVSGIAMARAFGKLIDFSIQLRRRDRCGKRVHLLSHSLGNFALRHAVQSIIDEGSNARVRLFDTVFLANADEDKDTLDSENKLRPLTHLADDIVVHFDENDKLVKLGMVANGERLGHKGPWPFASTVVNGCRLTALDCRQVQYDLGDDETRHRPFLHASSVIADIRAVIGGAAPAEIPNRTPTTPGFYLLGARSVGSAVPRRRRRRGGR